MSLTAERSKSLRLIDSHCHFDLPELAQAQDRLWREAQQVGVAALVIPAVSATAWPNLLKLHAEQPAWHIALGIHPWWAAEHTLLDVAQLDQLIRQQADKVCAVGEIGLDFALAENTFATQQQLFESQLAVAKKHAKPVILHHRKSQPQLLAELKRQQFDEGGILHAFSGSQQQASAFLDRGFKLGIGGTITYERARKTRNSIQKLPLNSFVLETDAPAMPLAGSQGQINTPARLIDVFNTFSQLRIESRTELAAALWQNTAEVLRLV
ncbi:MAG: DNAase [Rheinheimera sp.]|uniref:TatD family hydrolase n=1 Tax=Arsukibacterium sp. UBA3155 TaxID=1946058 RepID=UPI000C8F44F7|nr:TatD family hydrolase [Arsukibacterium sp. UBA3155]MAD74325.1 DNAase [Rheinheimera sp.]|tara:strand:+ start:5631 stop:6434 length:804 start_codon:yes stop_codon:yes gene_type:complete